MGSGHETQMETWSGSKVDAETHRRVYRLSESSAQLQQYATNLSTFLVGQHS